MGTIGWPAEPRTRLGARSVRICLGRIVRPSLTRGPFFKKVCSAKKLLINRDGTCS